MAITVPDIPVTAGATPYHLVSANTTNATNVKNLAGQMTDYAISNMAASARYVKFYDKATTPSVGTDTPKHTIQVLANSTVIRAFPAGSAYNAGIGFGTTTGAGDSDTNAVGAGDLIIDLDYK